MGLLDSLLGNVEGSSATSRTPSGSSTSPMVKAILLLLAAKAAQSISSRSGNAQAGHGPATQGGLGGLLPGGLGGLLGGAAAGAAGSGLLGGLLERMRSSGFSDQVDSWINTGPNKRIEPHEMARALGPDTISELEQHTGLPRDQLLDELSHDLPESIDHATPEGRVPSDDEIWSGRRT